MRGSAVSVFRRAPMRTDQPGVAAFDGAFDGTDHFVAMPTLLTRHDVGVVTVTVDGHAWVALEWAAAEASVRRCGLRIVYALGSPVGSADQPRGAPISPNTCPTETGSGVLDDAARRARAIAPGLAITTDLQRGGAARATLRSARGDALIVMERHEPGPPGVPITRSASWAVARRAQCPMVIVSLAEEPRGGSSAGCVVVGIDNTRDSAAALGLAFRSALRRGVGVTLVRAWTPCRRPDVDNRVDERNTSSPDDGRSDSELRLWQAMFPEVVVRRRLATGRLGPALVVESEGAALLIVAATVRGRLHRRLADSVGETVLEEARCPVAIIGPQNRRTKTQVGQREV